MQFFIKRSPRCCRRISKKKGVIALKGLNVYEKVKKKFSYHGGQEKYESSIGVESMIKSFARALPPSETYFSFVLCTILVAATTESFLLKKKVPSLSS